MDDLTNKLKSLELDRDQLESISWGYVRLSDEGVEQIKQTFIDAGWFYRGDIALSEDATEHIPIADNNRIHFNRGLMWAVENYVKTGRLKTHDLMTREEWEQQATKEGYARVKKNDYRDINNAPFTQITISYPDGSGEYARIPQFGYMTGQEWYDRFEKTVSAGDISMGQPANYLYFKEYFKVLAKKAAGLS